MFALRWVFTSALLASVVSSTQTSDANDAYAPTVSENIESIAIQGMFLENMTTDWNGDSDGGRLLIATLLGTNAQFDTATATSDQVRDDEAQTINDNLSDAAQSFDNSFETIIAKKSWFDDGNLSGDLLQALYGFTTAVTGLEQTLVPYMPEDSRSAAWAVLDSMKSSVQNAQFQFAE